MIRLRPRISHPRSPQPQFGQSEHSLAQAQKLDICCSRTATGVAQGTWPSPLPAAQNAMQSLHHIGSGSGITGHPMPSAVTPKGNVATAALHRSLDPCDLIAQAVPCRLLSPPESNAATAAQHAPTGMCSIKHLSSQVVPGRLPAHCTCQLVRLWQPPRPLLTAHCHHQA